MGPTRQPFQGRSLLQRPHHTKEPHMHERWYVQIAKAETAWETYDAFTTYEAARLECDRWAIIHPRSWFRVIHSKPELTEVYRLEPTP